MLRPIDSTYTNYLRNQIESSNPLQIKKGLQRLCKLYRQGFRISNPETLLAIETLINGLLFTQTNDQKINRWALNAIAQLGRPEYSLDGVNHALNKFQNDPEIIASAIAAFFTLNNNAQGKLNKLDKLPHDLIILAGLQRAPIEDIDMTGTRIDIEKSTPEILKLSLITVGLDKAPDNLFHPRYSNSEIVSALGSHHDKMVTQYSIWAITENDTLGLRDLGIKLNTIESHPDNVRSWIYQLIAMNSEEAQANFEYIRLGMEEGSSKARGGLAEGIRDTFFDGLEALMLDWFYSESEEDVRSAVLDHFVRQSEQCPNYRDTALEIYKNENPGSALRQRMEAIAGGTKLYSEFKRLSLSNELDLFGYDSSGYRRGINMTKTIINISGGIHDSAVSLTGDAINRRSTKTVYSADIIEEIQNNLNELREGISESEIPSHLKDESDSAIENALADTSPDKITLVLRVLEKVKSVVGSLAGTVDSIDNFISSIQNIGG